MTAYAGPRLVRAPGRVPMNPLITLIKEGAAGTATSTRSEPAPQRLRVFRSDGISSLAPLGRGSEIEKLSLSQPCRFSGCQPANLG